MSPLCACLRDDNDFADPDLSCLEHALDGTGNGAVKAITLHTFVDVSLSYSYSHLTDHPSQARKRAESFVLACTRIPGHERKTATFCLIPETLHSFPGRPS